MRRVLIAAAVLLAGCSSSSAPASGSHFPSFESVCDHGNRLYWLPSYGSMAVASQDPTCAQ